MADVTFDDDPGRSGPASTVATPPGVPRITVAPGATAPVTFDDDPGKPARAGDRTRQLIAEQSKMGWPAWLNQGAGDFLAAGSDMASFGMRPRLDAATGAVTGTYPDYATGLQTELQTARQRAERSPIATMGGNVVGGIAGGIAGGASRLGANIAGRALPYVPASLAKVLGFGTEAGVVGAGQAAGHVYSGKPEDYLEAGKEGFTGGAIVGGLLGPLTPTSAVKMRPGDPRTGQPIREPTNAELLARSDNGYQTLAKIPVTYPGSHLQGQLSAAESQMIQQNVAPEQAKTVFAILERMRKHPGSISPAQVDGWRQSLNNMKNVPTPGAEKAGVAAAILRDSLDDMIQNGAQAASNPVLAQQAAQWVKQARGDRAAMFRSQQLTDPLTNATVKAQTGGPPVGEQLGSKGVKLLETKRGQQPNTRGWIDEERNQVAQAITPTLPERAAKFGADYFGRDIPALAGGKLLADRLRGFSAGGIQQRWEDAAAAMRQRSPSYQRATQGSVPVAGPGQGMLPQAIQGAVPGQLTTPYDDGRNSLAAQMMQQFSY